MWAVVFVLVLSLAVMVSTVGPGSVASGSPVAKSAKKKKKKKKGTGGPIVLAGIDAADQLGGSCPTPCNGHGPVANYAALLNSVLASAKDRGRTVLVIGGGKSPTDDVTTWWNTVASSAGATVSYANGAAISSANFNAFEVVAVADSVFTTSSGGLTQAEEDLLAARKSAVASYVNGNGGLIGFAQSGLTNPFGYLAVLGNFSVVTDQSYQDITPTPAGVAVGITDALDVCCWHDTFTTFPKFLKVLATDTATGQVAALGGNKVFVGKKKKKKKKKAKPKFTG